MGKYTLWTLNRVATWDLNRLADELSVRSMFSQRHEVILGSRSSADLIAAQSKTGVLSHEEKAWDEYFVPIVVKCIGDPQGFLRRLGPRFSPSGSAAAAQVIASFPQYFTPALAGAWKGYWTLAGTTGMFTAPTSPAQPDGYRGFYELIVEAADRTGPGVLVGYSQGGLVARFLAYLDELLMPPAKRCVAGVITVQAPNHGSPLANSDHANAESVSDGLFSILTGVAGYPISPVDTAMNVRDPATTAMLKAIVRNEPMARGWHADINIPALLFEAGVADAQANGKSADFPATARKWLTGLLPQPVPTAFLDLDPRNLDQPMTVLGRVHRSPLAQTWHGAVIGSDTSVDDFIAAGKGCLLQFIIRHAPGWLNLGRTLEAIEKPYALICMDQTVSGSAMGREQTRVGQAYRSTVQLIGPGSSTATLPPFAHDFVIPSASQAMHLFDNLNGLRPPKFLGNLVNRKGTHISGGNENDDDSDSKLVRSLLADLGKALQ